MTKKEYDKITKLLNKRKEYNEVVEYLKSNKYRFLLIITDNYKLYECARNELDEEEINDLQDYLSKKLENINKELKELGYND